MEEHVSGGQEGWAQEHSVDANEPLTKSEGRRHEL